MDRLGDPRGMSASEFVDFIYSKVGRPFKPSKHLAPDSTQIHLGLTNMLGLFHENTVSLSPKPGKFEELHSSFLEIRTRQSQKATLGEIMVLAGKLIFLLMSCFNKMARGGLQPFFQWLSDHCTYSSTTSSDRLDGKKGSSAPSAAQASLTKPHSITASLAMGFEFFIKGIPLLKPRIYKLGELKKQPVLVYSDAKWTVLEKPPWLLKGLGGILWKQGCKPQAAAGDTPQHLVDALSHRKTQIIPLELMAAAGMMFTYGPTLRGEDIMFFIDHQSVCCALVKGCSKSWDIQLLATCWQLMCLQMGCRVWIEWVPSESNPADILSCEGLSLFPTASGEIDKLRLPLWTDVSIKDLKNVLDTI